MCPTSTSTSSTTWQDEASYSNNILKISPGSSSYTISQSSATGSKPIAEAGFTLTGLAPSISNSSSGVATQAQNFVLLGGHTQTAFINMSQIAIFSLPQESWSYQNIDTVSDVTELAVRSTTTVATPDSRSGHTAILSSDGTAIIVFGGWVGDIDTPASPQLAILKLGSGYGGTGDWAWEIPTTTGSGLSSSQGIYGHAAVMLPGDVMMVTGGTLVTSSGSKVKRTTTKNTYFLNTTSSSWVSTYTNPSYTAAKAAASSAAAAVSSSTNNTAKKVGLGAGLGIGLSAVVAAISVFLWYNHRLRKKKEEARQQDLQNLAKNPTQYYGHGGIPEMEERENSKSFARSGRPISETSIYDISPVPIPPDGMGNRGMGLGRGGNSGYMPVAYAPGSDGHNTQGDNRGSVVPRKPVGAWTPRGHYQAAPSSNGYSSFDFGMSSHNRDNSLGTAGAIHPIYEADEDADITDSQLHQSGRGRDVKSTSLGRISLDHGPVSPMSDQGTDPFRDPSPTRSGTVIRHSQQALGSHPPAMSSAAQEREREVASWVADWTAADALLHAQTRMQSGRMSPSKESSSGRTRSDLSDGSAASAFGALSRTSSTNRANSLTAFFAGSNWNPFSGQGTNPHDSFFYGPGDASPGSERSSRSQNPPTSSGSGTSSFNTAQTSQSYGRGGVILGQPAPYEVRTSSGFPAMRQEGQSLLSRPHGDEPGSPSKSRGRRQMGWLGSIKRVFGAEEWVSASEPSSDGSSPTRDLGLRTAIGSGAALTGDGRPQPQRSASAASAMLWRRKQGREDWEDSAGGQRSNTLTETSSPFDTGRGPTAQSADDEEWDIERAVRERVVQVMFTVPKEKLRVVNHNIEDDRSDLGSVTGSMKSVKSKKSMQQLARKKSEMNLEDIPESKGHHRESIEAKAANDQTKAVEIASSTTTGSPYRAYTPTAERAQQPSPYRAYTPTSERTEQTSSYRAYTPMTELESGSETAARKHQPSESNTVGERIEGRRIGEIVGRPSSPEKRKSKVLDMVQKLEK